MIKVKKYETKYSDIIIDGEIVILRIDASKKQVPSKVKMDNL